MKRIAIIMAVSMALAIAGTYGWMQYRTTTIHCGQSKELSDAKQVGLALKLYASDHEGILPKSLTELSPDAIGLEDLDRLIADTEFLAAGQSLADLPPDTIILRRTIPEKPHLVVTIRADISGTVEKKLEK